MSSTNSLWC